MKKLLKLCRNYIHALPAILYGMVYLTWFFYLERTVTDDYTVIHMKIDDYIPFVEVFVIPYMMWFGYMAMGIIYLILTDKKEYIRSAVFLGTGMTIFLIISTLWPNGHHLRPDVMPRDNFFTSLIEGLYETDTATNLWPSIHVYNSIAIHIGLMHSKGLKDKKLIRLLSWVLCISIVLSTVFIKQHSMFDVLTAFALAAVMYVLVYRVWKFGKNTI